MKHDLLSELATHSLDASLGPDARSAFLPKMAEGRVIDAAAATALLLIERLYPCRHLTSLDQLPPEQQIFVLSEFAALRSSLEAWAPDESSHERLMALFALTAAWDADRGYWSALSHTVSKPSPWLKAAEHMLRNFEVHPTLDGSAATWKKDVLRALLDADSTDDWPVLIDLTRQFHFAGDSDFVQAARALAACAPDRLAAVLDATSSWVKVAMILRDIDSPERYGVAAAAKTPRARLVALELGGHDLSSDQTAVRALLIAVAEDLTQWTICLSLFLAPVIQYPSILSALGYVLSQVSKPALAAFIDAADLSPTSLEQHPLGAILIDFADHANDDQRRTLWQYAFDRWERWAFGLPGAEGMMLGPSGSTMDVAVAGWLIDEADASVLLAGQAQAEHHIATIDQHWHESSTDLMRQVYAWRSRYLMFADAFATRNELPMPPAGVEEVMDAYRKARYAGF